MTLQPGLRASLNLNAGGNFDDLIGGKEAIDHETEVANETHHDQICPAPA
jgi:hypothetical protein